MADIVLIDPRITALIQGAFGANGMPMPFVQEIFLLECHIAGTSYLDLEEVEPTLAVNDVLVMKRQPENKHDTLAIMLLTVRGEKLGYVPRDKNEVIARLMDAGKLIFGKIVSKNYHGDWLKLIAQIYMREI